MRYKKICIIGPGGAGKSTFAAGASEKLGIPHIEMDKIVWRIEKGLYIKNDRSYTEEHTNNIVKKDEWIIEGAYISRFRDLFIASDIVIVLDPGYIIRTYRIMMRYFKSKVNKVTSNETIFNSIEIILYNRRFLKQLQVELRETDLYKKTINCRSAEDIYIVFSNKRNIDKQQLGQKNNIN